MQENVIIEYIQKLFLKVGQFNKILILVIVYKKNVYIVLVVIVIYI